MAKQHTTYESLLADIQTRSQKALKKNVAPIVEKKLQESAKMVEGRFSRAANGIADPHNIVSEVIGDALVIMDKAKPQDSWLENPRMPYSSYTDPYSTLFSEWVEEGRWEEWPPDGSHTKRSAIPFVSDVQNEINSNSIEIINALEKAFK